MIKVGGSRGKEMGRNRDGVRREKNVRGYVGSGRGENDMFGSVAKIRIV